MFLIHDHFHKAVAISLPANLHFWKLLRPLLVTRQ